MNLSVTNILRYKKYPYYSSAWKQAGLFYFFDPNFEIGNLEGAYMTRINELEWIHDIKVMKNNPNNSKEFLESVTSLLNEDNPILVEVDTYYTTGNMYYQSRHTLHTITIIGIEDSNLIYVDDSYGFIEKISFQQLIRSTSSEELNLSNKYMYLVIPNEEIPKNEKLFEPITFNNKIIKGENVEISIPDIPSNDFVSGLDAIDS